MGKAAIIFHFSIIIHHIIIALLQLSFLSPHEILMWLHGMSVGHYIWILWLGFHGFIWCSYVDPRLRVQNVAASGSSD